MSASDWINLLVALGTWGAVVVAISVSLGWLAGRAKLEVYLRSSPPDAARISSTMGNVQFWSYYWRLRVYNWGPSEAKGVEVQMVALRKKGPHGMETDPVFLPLDLQWAFGEDQRPRLLPRIFRYCDLVHVDDWTKMPNGQPQIVFHNVGFPRNIPNELRPGERPTIKPPGEYELDVAIAAGNARTIRRTISIKFDNKFWDTEADMFSNGTRVDVLPPRLRWYERVRKDPLG